MVRRLDGYRLSPVWKVGDMIVAGFRRYEAAGELPAGAAGKRRKP
jgi:hypothetical protein